MLCNIYIVVFFLSSNSSFKTKSLTKHACSENGHWFRRGIDIGGLVTNHTPLCALPVMYPCSSFSFFTMSASSGIIKFGCT